MDTSKNPNIIIVKEKNNKPDNVITAQKPEQDKPYSRILFLFFVFFQLFLSFDFGFIQCKSRRQRIIVKILTMIPALILLMAICYHIVVASMPTEYNLWLLYEYLQYSLMVVCSVFFNRQNSFCVFLENLSDIDNKINIQVKTSGSKIIGFSILALFLKASITYTHCTLIPPDCINQPVISIIMFIISTIVDFPLILYFLSFHFTHCRVKNLKNIINDCYKPNSDHIIYKSLVDGIEKCKKCFDVLYVFSLLNKVPVALITTYVIIRDTKYNSGKFDASVLIYFNWVFQYMIIVIVPAVTASRLAQEVEKIKLILHDNLLLGNATGSKAAVIGNFLLYIEARPMRFRVYNVIPLNSTFPFLILNIFITYLIVAVQLSHIY